MVGAIWVNVQVDPPEVGLKFAPTSKAVGTPVELVPFVPILISLF